MPTEKQTKALALLTKNLLEALKDKGVPIRTAIFIGNRTARYEYYGISVERFAPIVDETFANYPALPIKIGAKSDPQWSNYIETIQQFAIQP